VQSASGEWIYFADDDITIPDGFFLEFLRVTREKPDFDVIGGPNLNPVDSNAFQTASGLALASPLASFRCADRYRKAPALEDCDDSKLILCNLFVRKNLTKRGPFPASYLCAEENFALANWRERGARFLYEPQLAVLHRRREKPGQFLKQVLKYGRGRGRLVAAGEFSWYHLVPSSLLFLFFAALVTPVIRASFVGACVFYFFALAFESFRLNRFHLKPRVLLIAYSIFLVHLGYAFGVLLGATFDHRKAGAMAEEIDVSQAHVKVSGK
ncbi:MAG: hypothetical protein V4692_06665, partial [Bdellovibrionota bacterium]